ncbi:MAG: LCP family protein [Eubacteriales bacterium]|nr:LCP family protein [Eubacteriales bacterium]
MKKRKKKSNGIAGMIAALLLVGLLFGGGMAVVNAELNKINREENSVTEAGTSTNSNIMNILVIGQDRRPGEDRARSDSMILCSYNKTTKNVTMISFMRDMYVEIPGYGKTKINAAYAYGGMSLLDQTIENNFGVHIDGNIEVDFEAFMTVIDDIGGVEIELNQEEADYLNVNNTGLVDGTTTDAWTLTAGVNTLTSQQALAYARTRYVGNSDWERTDRQRRVMTAIINKFKSIGVTQQMSLINTVLPTLTTDMSNGTMISLGSSIVMSGMNLNGESYRIPVEGTYTSDNIDGMAVLVPDLEANKQYLQQYIGQ